MPDRNRKPPVARQDFEVAYYTKELGRDLQREMLQKQLSQLSENGSIRSSHREALPPEPPSPPVLDDRAD